MTALAKASVPEAGPIDRGWQMRSSCEQSSIGRALCEHLACIQRVFEEHLPWNWMMT